MAAKVTVSFPEEFLAEVDRIAAKEHRSRSELLREAHVTDQEKAHRVEKYYEPNFPVLLEEDVKELLAGLWHGTQNLISRSKFGQMPRLLLKVNYKEKGFFIGDMDKKIKITGCENPLKIRSLKDFTLDISDLLLNFFN